MNMEVMVSLVLARLSVSSREGNLEETAGRYKTFRAFLWRRREAGPGVRDLESPASLEKGESWTKSRVKAFSKELFLKKF